LDGYKKWSYERSFKLVGDVMFYGTTLHLIAYGTTIDWHLQVI
jgi:hypothetical protein